MFIKEGKKKETDIEFKDGILSNTKKRCCK